MSRLLLLFMGLALIGFRTDTSSEVDRFTVPEGFAVEEVYTPEQASTVIAFTFDSQGRLVLSREDSSIVTLLDPDRDGHFEERIFTDEVHDSQGIFFDGPDLIAVGMGPDSVAMYRVVDVDLDSRGDRIEVMEKSIGRMSDHGPHQPFFGPDGYLYWTLGNMSGPYSSPAPLSPFRDYEENTLALLRTDPRGHAASIRIPGGTFARKNLDDPNAQWEEVVGGFRNQYDGAFNLMGELFTFDSDMEWDRDLPWYRGTRSVHAVPGGDYGWRTGSRKHHAYYIDTLPPMQDMGRGSPTGVTFYQSYAYPASYKDVFLQADWSRGRIIAGTMVREGATYTQQNATDFVYGEPLNVTDVEVGPDGNVYFALGGRNTQGGVYRVVYKGSDRLTAPQTASPIERVLTMPQPRSAWSRETARNIKTEIGEDMWQRGLALVMNDTQASPERRIRAMELLHVFGPGLSSERLIQLSSDAFWEVRAASTYYLGVITSVEESEAQQALIGRLKDEDPFVQRRAAEALIRTGLHPAVSSRVDAINDVFPLLHSDDRFVRFAGKELLRRMNRNVWREAVLELDDYPAVSYGLLAYVQSLNQPSVKDITFLVERELELLEANPTDSELLDLIRVMQVTMVNDLGLTFPGSGFNNPKPGPYQRIGSLLLDRFPTGKEPLDREIARVFAHLKPEEAAPALSAELQNESLSREHQIFYAYALSAIDTGWDDASRELMISWFEKVRNEQWKGGASFVGYLSYMLDDFAAHQPEEVKKEIKERVPQLTLQIAANGRPSFRGPEYRVWLSDSEIEEDLIYNPGSFDADTDEGAEAYTKAYCATCHTFGPLGLEFGPDLTTVAQRFSRPDLVRAVLYPSETISDLWTVQEITKTNGEKVSGTIYREDAQEVIVQIPGGGQVTIPTSEISSREESSVSPMPEGLLNNLSLREMRALFVFLEAGPEAIPDSLLSSTSR